MPAIGCSASSSALNGATPGRRPSRPRSWPGRVRPGPYTPAARRRIADHQRPLQERQRSVKLLTARARPFAVYGHFSQPGEGSLYDLPLELRYLLASAAARMTAATSFGRDCIATWLVGSAVVVAWIFFAIACSSAGWIIRSFSATMYQEGLFFQAALVTLSPKVLPRIGPWVTAITRVRAAGRSWAKSLAIPSGDR